MTFFRCSFVTSLPDSIRESTDLMCLFVANVPCQVLVSDANPGEVKRQCSVATY